VHHVCVPVQPRQPQRLNVASAHAPTRPHDLEGHIDADCTRQVRADALSAPWDGVDRWFHGDIADGNLLLDDAGQLAAVIDFGTCGVGDRPVTSPSPGHS
jgi:aminoglycoside phosphotransferase (APT) family kinase protein